MCGEISNDELPIIEGCIENIFQYLVKYLANELILNTQ